MYPLTESGGVYDVPNEVFELMAYAVQTLTSAFNYELMPTAAATSCGVPCTTSRNLVKALIIRQTRASLYSIVSDKWQLSIPLDPQYIGQPIYFKLLAFNPFGNNVQDPATVAVYKYTIPPGVLSPSYQQNPPFALTNPTSTTLAMAQLTEQFPDNLANYNARPSIAIPGGAPSVPTLLYVTISDPAQLGDTGTMTNLTVNVQTAAQEASTPKVGVPGFTYVGAIQVFRPEAVTSSLRVMATADRRR